MYVHLLPLCRPDNADADTRQAFQFGADQYFANPEAKHCKCHQVSLSVVDVHISVSQACLTHSPWD